MSEITKKALATSLKKLLSKKELAKSMRQTVLLEPVSDMPSVQKLMGGI